MQKRESVPHVEIIEVDPDWHNYASLQKFIKTSIRWWGIFFWQVKVEVGLQGLPMQHCYQWNCSSSVTQNKSDKAWVL